MKKQLLASVAAVALAAATPAIAAPPASMPAAPVYNWTGFYAGGNIGYSWGSVNSGFYDPGFPGGFGSGSCCELPSSYPAFLKPNGLIGGAQAGYNWQVGTKWVFGLEADLQGSAETAQTGFSNSYDCEGFNGPTICNLRQTRSAKIQWFDTVRGRFGFLLTPTLWLYGTAGLAFGKVSAFGTVTDDPQNTGASFAFGSSQINGGYAVGAGIEGAFANSKNWTWKVEYLYIDLGSLSGGGVEPISGSPYTWNAHFTDNIMRVGFNYRFP
jgi:outer membrane immunogenic protein